MLFYKSFSQILNSVFRPILYFILFSCLFIGANLAFDYQKYKQSFEFVFHKDKEDSQKALNTSLKNLTKLLQLISLRISKAEGNIDRIQKILSTVHQLNTAQEYTEFQKISYLKISAPSSTITRFGILPAPADISQITQTIVQNVQISLEPQKVLGKIAVFNTENKIEGLLEIEVEFQTFITNILLSKESYQFEPSIDYQKIDYIKTENFSIPIYIKACDNLRTYLNKNFIYYGSFLIYIFLSILFISYVFLFLKKHIYKIFQLKIEDLEKDLLQAQEMKDELEVKNLKQHQEIQAYTNYSHSYKEIIKELNYRQKDQITYVTNSLNIIEQYLKNPSFEISEIDIMELTESCSEKINSLSILTWNHQHNQNINVANILKQVQYLFSEKIYKSQLTFEINCLASLTYNIDPLFLKILLINIIGKIIYHLPLKGKISIFIDKHKDGLRLRISDNSYTTAVITEKFIKKAFDFLINDDLFQKICSENNIIFQYFNDEDNFRRTEIIIPIFYEKKIDHNVIKLFK